jgi:hypothetical protein
MTNKYNHSRINRKLSQDYKKWRVGEVEDY